MNLFWPVGYDIIFVFIYIFFSFSYLNYISNHLLFVLLFVLRDLLKKVKKQKFFFIFNRNFAKDKICPFCFSESETNMKRTNLLQQVKHQVNDLKTCDIYVTRLWDKQVCAGQVKGKLKLSCNVSQNYSCYFDFLSFKMI